MKNIDPEFLNKQLQQRDIRPSYQRLKVLETLYKLEGHPNVEELFEVLSQEIPPLSKATIYNTLHTFVDAGLVRSVGIDDEELRYDIIMENHGHFKCVKCGKIYNFAIDIDCSPIRNLEHFQILEKNVYFKGVCPSCASILEKSKGE